MWTLDSAHSSVTFSVRHMMLSRVRGEFERFGGEIEFDAEHPEATQVDIEIDAASISTGVAQRDDHLRSGDFLDAANYPVIRFLGTGITLHDAHRATLQGDLAIRDVTRPVALEVTYGGQVASPWGSNVVGFGGHTVIDRRDWGLTWNKALEAGGFLVGDEIEIDVELELVAQQQLDRVAA